MTKSDVRWLIVLFVCLLGVSVYSLNHQLVRVDGADTPNTGQYNFVCDSTDTFQVDTVYSDTVNIENYTFLHYFIGLSGYALADSANDSVIVLVKGYGLSEGKFPTLMFTDTINSGSVGALDSSTIQVGVKRIDSTAFNSMYLMTIISDSFIQGAGCDTSEFRFLYQISQSVPVSR